MSESNTTSTIEPISPIPADEPIEETHPPRFRWAWVAALTVVVGLGAFFLRQGSNSARTAGRPSAASRGPAAIPIVAARARKENIGVYLTGLGVVTPIYTVTVKSRVDGQLLGVAYKEGEFVKQGRPPRGN